MYSGERKPSGFPSTKQKSQWFPQRRIRGGSSVTPIGSPSGRSMSYSTSSPVGSRAANRKRSSAVRNSQSRKSSSGRPFTANNAVPGTIPTSLQMEWGARHGRQGGPFAVGDEAEDGDLDREAGVGPRDIGFGGVTLPPEVPPGSHELQRRPVERVERQQPLRRRQQGSRVVQLVVGHGERKQCVAAVRVLGEPERERAGRGPVEPLPYHARAGTEQGVGVQILPMGDPRAERGG